MSTEKTWQWLKGAHLKKETEAMVCAAQEQALRVNLIKQHIDGQNVSLMCSLYDESSETVIAKSKYRIRHDIVDKHIH